MDKGHRHNRRNIISLNIHSVDYDDALRKIIAAAKERTSGYVCFANVHMIIEAYHHKDFAEQVNNAMLVLPDGMPVVNALKSLYNERPERIAGMDAFPDLIGLAEVHGLKIFLFGTTNELLEKIRSKTQKDFPKVEIAGMFSPPFNKSLDNKSFIDMIIESGAHLVFVALGCPKQEKWMATHSHKIPAILLGIGGAFPVYAGATKRAPQWMRNLSLEWLFRLYQEPTRLFKRYLFTNSLFLYLTLKIKARQIFN